tara:strand:- start:635 stop:916 length:282 start_codon:yes stop_codon:yes gene_type:complete
MSSGFWRWSRVGVEAGEFINRLGISRVNGGNVPSRKLWYSLVARLSLQTLKSLPQVERAFPTDESSLNDVDEERRELRQTILMICIAGKGEVE